MKTKVKRMSKRTLAMLLGVLMLVTSIGFGSLITVGATTTYYVHSNHTGTSGSDNPANFNTHTLMTADGSVYTASIPNYTGSGNVYFNINESSSSGESGGRWLNGYFFVTGSGVTSGAVQNYGSYDRVYVDAGSASNVYIILNTGTSTLTVTTTDPSGGGGGEDPGEGGGGGGSAVEITDNGIIQMLLGNNYFFYIGNKTWNNTNTHYAVQKVNDTATKVGSTSVTDHTIDSSSGKFGPVSIPKGIKTAVTHDSSLGWVGEYVTQPLPGGAIYNWTNNNKNDVGTPSGSIASNWTTSTASVKYGATSCDLSASESGTSVAGHDLSTKYFIKVGAKYYEFDPAAIPTDLDLAPGTYTVYATAYDGYVYVKATDGSYGANGDGSLTVYPRLTTPTITIDGESSESAVTASTTEKSKILVTNVNSYAEGTIFRLYRSTDSGSTYSLVDSNTSGNFTVSRNTGTDGIYKVIAVPGEEDTTHSDSADSNTVTLTVTRIAKPDAPVLTVDKNNINVDGKITLTVSNFATANSDAGYDPAIYDLKIYKVNDNTTNTSTVTTDYNKSFSEATFVDTAVDSTTFGNYEKEYAHYKVKAVPKDSTVYTESDFSNPVHVKAIKAQWHTYGNNPFGTNNDWTNTHSVAITNYYKDEIFYGVYDLTSVASNAYKYFRFSRSGSGGDWGPSTDGTSAIGDEEHKLSFENNSSNTGKSWKLPGGATYFVFVEQTAASKDTKIWARSDLAQITISKKYMTYNLATDTYSSPEGDDGSRVTVNTGDVFVKDSGASFTVTAHVENAGYEFVGWYDTSYSDENLITTSTTLSVASATTKTYVPIVRQKIPNKNNVIVEDNKHANISAGWNSKTAKNARTLLNVPVGASVTLTATAKDGYSIEKIEWKSADGGSGTVTSGSTFTMPDSTVTVTVTTKPDKYFWYHKGTSNTTKNENITPVNPSNTGNEYWTYDSKIEVDKINGIYTAKIPASYFNSTYYSTFCFSDSKDTVFGQMFYRSSSDTAITVNYGDDTSSTYITAYNHKYNVASSEWGDLSDRNYYYAKVQFKTAAALANASYVLMQADTNNRKYTFTLVSSDNPKSYNFVAKDGPAAKTSRIDNSKYYDSIGKAGDFYVKNQAGSANIGTVDSTTYSAIGVQKQTGVMKQGTTYQFCCVIKDPRYYVKAFNVNGISVCVFDKPASRHSVDDVVVGYYTVPDDAGDEFEIEPVFYHYDDSDCVTFYLESYDSVIQDNVGWGHTPYIYPFYATVTGSSSGGADAARNAYGAYPGTAMVFENGLYEIQLPVTNIDLVGTGTTEDGANIKGITINNGYYDLIHRGEMGWSNSDDQYHMQTYDFDDFHKIYEEKNPTNIYFKIKLREDRDNSKEYRHTLDTTLSSADLNDIRDNGNGWELLQDRHNRTIDLFGNPLTTEQAALDPLYVISTGYVANTAGSYGTAWQIYYKDGNSYKLVRDTTNGVDSIPPSLLFVNTAENLKKDVYPTNSYTGNSVDGTTINPGTLGDPETYTALYNTLKTTYSGKPVMLSYEMNDRHTKSNYGDSGDDVSGAWRLDGRWYYTTAGDNIKSTIEIEYLDGAAGYVAEKSYVTGYDGEQNQGSHTGANAFFTDTDYDYYAKRETGDVVLDKTKTFNMTAQAADGYEFEGWYIKSDSSYISMNATDLKKTTATVQRSAGQTFVARYKKLTTGKLSITNTATTGTAINGTTYTGAGTAALTVEITENNGTNWKTLATDVTSYTLGAEYLNDEKLSNNNMKLKITASGTATGSDGFGTIDNVYTSRSQANNTAYTIQLNKLFTSTEVDGNTVYEQQTFSLPFKTYFVAHTYEYNITYTYPSTRLNAIQTYTASGSIKSTLVSSVTTAGGVLTNAFIEGKKPTESNFMKHMDFTIDTSTTSTDGTVTTYTATAHYSINDAQSGKVTVMLDLPYAVTSRTVGSYNFAAASASPKYNTTFAKIPLKDLTQGYGGYLSSTGTVISTTDGLLTAPESVVKNIEGKDTTKYFSYWNVTNLDGVVEFRCYNTEFNYRLYDNYIITPVYNNDVGRQNISNAAEYKNATISYTGTTRNQWNNNGCGAYTAGTDAQDEASDILFNDFEVAYNYKALELKEDTNADCGVILQKIDTVGEDASGNKITDLDYYQEKNSATEESDAETIKTFIDGGSKGGLSLQKYSDLRSNLNNKNRFDFYYATYNTYGWNGETNAPATTRTVKQNIYRAYAYLKYSGDNTVYLSAPVYFTMYDVATS